MNSKTLDVMSFPSREVALAAGYDIPLSDAQARRVEAMNLDDRRRYVEQRLAPPPTRQQRRFKERARTSR